jgi:flagellar hook-associated protein FlgK
VKSINSLHSTGYTLNGNTGTDFFQASSIRARDIQLSAAVLDDSNNIAAAAGGTVIGPIQLQPPPSVPAFGTPLDLKLIDPQFKNLSQGSVKIQHSGQTLDEGAGKDYVVDYNNGSITFLNYSRYAAGDPLTVAFSRNTAGYPGPGDGNNALNIAQMRDQYTMGADNLGNPNKTIGDFYNSFIGVLGIERNQTKSNKETRNFLVDQFKTKKQEVSGVSLDEELGNMIKFEHTYQASARFMRSINDLMDILMNI